METTAEEHAEFFQWRGVPLDILELNTGLRNDSGPTPVWSPAEVNTQAYVCETARGNMTNSSAFNMGYYFYKTEQLTFLCILFAFIIFGNTSVLVAIVLSKNRKSRVNFFIMMLAMADLLTGLIPVLTDIGWKFTVEWHAGNMGCKIVRFMQGVPTYASTYVLVSLSIDRVDAIARPMSFSGSGKRAKILISAAWTLSVLFSTPMLLLNKEKYVRGIKQCWIDMPKGHWRVYVTLLALVLFILPGIIIAICYTVIVIVIWSKGSVSVSSQRPISRRFTKRNGSMHNANKHQVDVLVETQSGSASSRGLIPKAKIKTIKMTLVIVIAFVCCWCPFFIFDLLDVYGHLTYTQQTVAIAVFIQSLVPLNSAANPIIYFIFNAEVCRTTYGRFWICRWLSKKLCCRRRKTPLQRHSFKSTSMTTYSTISNGDDHRHHVNHDIRRHPGSAYAKVTLHQRGDQVFLKQNLNRKSGNGTLQKNSAPGSRDLLISSRV